MRPNGWRCPNPKEYTFYLADRMVEWAEQNNTIMRGHTLLWQKTQYFPKWLVNYDFGTRPATEAERILRDQHHHGLPPLRQAHFLV